MPETAHLPMPVGELLDAAPWPWIIRVNLSGSDEFALVGIARTDRQMYSGGSAAVTHLNLFEVRPRSDGKGAVVPVLEAPLAGSVMIRACFTPEDERARLSICHDEYRYAATLRLAPSKDAAIRLIYNSRADTFPGRRKRFDDSRDEPPLRRADIKRFVEPDCSINRIATRNPETGTFAWNAPLPPCGDFLDP